MDAASAPDYKVFMDIYGRKFLSETRANPFDCVVPYPSAELVDILLKAGTPLLQAEIDQHLEDMNNAAGLWAPPESAQLGG